MLESKKRGRVLFTQGDTEVRLHTSFWLLPIILIAPVIASGDVRGAIIGIGTILLLMVFVVAHEFGHVAAGRYYGIRTRTIMLLPIGGVAMMQGEGKTWKENIAISIAGPVVNLAIAGPFILAEILRLHVFGIGGPGFGILAMIAFMNVSLCLFNLIPVNPMDGGQILKAALSSRLNERVSTIISAVIGVVIASILGYIAWTSGWTLAAIILVLAAIAGIFDAVRVTRPERQDGSGDAEDRSKGS